VKKSHLFPLLLAALALALFAVGCGGDDNGDSGGTTAGGGETGATEGVKKIDPATMDGAKGDVVYCTGKDTSGGQKAAIDLFNKANPEIKATLFEFPESADEQRNQFVQRQRAKSADCDIFYADVVWTAEFAQQKWLYDMTPYVETRRDEFIPSTLESVTYDGKIFGSPQQTDAGLIYYHTDEVKEVPATWQALYDEAKSKKGIVYQGLGYEGLTVNFLELAFAAGGKVLSDDGKKAEINSPENVKALQFMVDGIKDGAAPKAVTTYKEEEARRAFEAGKATFMRQWPYAYAAGKKNKNAPKFEVAPYPEWEGGGKAAILGGHNLVISVYSKNPGGALKLVDFLTKPEAQTLQAAEYSLAPVLASVYEDASVKKALPFAAELKASVEQAKSRPVSPVYPQVSQAIYKNVNDALSGKVSPEDALKAASDEIDKALATF
jgi:multiple sugar transport system substrate-binding protein